MAKKLAVTNLHASTLDVLNVIRENAGREYQDLIPKVTKETDIPAVGEVLMGYPAMANRFLSALINRIALVKVNSAVFNNAYSQFKKGYLEFGETVEEVFTGLIKARPFSAEKAAAREFKRTPPNVQAVFHIMNWTVQYPVTIQQYDLRQAFQNAAGVEDMIAKIISQIYTSVEYDEFLLFKYLLIKAVANNNVYKIGVNMSGKDGGIKQAGKAFRKAYNDFGFLSDTFNAQGVLTATPAERRYIFLDTEFEADYDVNVLASAFNIDKADYLGKRMLIDSWKSFDNDRFSEIIAESDMIDPVTPTELQAMEKVKAILVDSEWFQFYDNLSVMTEKEVAAGMYWNYFYNKYCTVSSSPFSNICAFIDSVEPIATPTTITAKVTGIDKDEEHKLTVFTLEAYDGASPMYGDRIKFIQTQAATEAGVAVHRYGAVILPDAAEYKITVEIPSLDKKYECASPNLTVATELGATFTCTAAV